METQRRRLYPSGAQKLRLIALLEADEELRRGKFSVTFTKKEGERRWQAIAEELNGIPGSKREWKEWRKTWQDMKSAAKKKNAACRFSAAATGGGPPPPPLSEENIAVLRSISTNSLIGHTDSKESLVQFQGRTYGIAEPENIIVPNKEVAEPENIIVLDKEDHPNSSDTTRMVMANIHDDHSYIPYPADASGVASMAVYEDQPGCSSVSPVVETQTDQVPEVAATDNKMGSNKNKENRTSKAGTKRRVAVRRLEESLAMGNAVQNLMQEKIELKRKYYESVIAIMTAQTEVLQKICEKL